MRAHAYHFLWLVRLTYPGDVVKLPIHYRESLKLVNFVPVTGLKYADNADKSSSNLSPKHTSRRNFGVMPQLEITRKGNRGV